MNTLEAIHARRSVRNYQPDVPVPRADIEQILEAAMMAPSACNVRPWEFVVVQSEAVKAQIMEIHPYTQMLRSAPVAIVVCGRPDLQEGICEGFWPQDCGAAIQNLLLAALELGYGTCWCGCYPAGDRAERLREALDVTGVPVAVVALGKANECPPARDHYEPEKVKFL